MCTIRITWEWHGTGSNSFKTYNDILEVCEIKFFGLKNMNI